MSLAAYHSLLRPARRFAGRLSELIDPSAQGACVPGGHTGLPHKQCNGLLVFASQGRQLECTVRFWPPIRVRFLGCDRSALRSPFHRTITRSFARSLTPSIGQIWRTKLVDCRAASQPHIGHHWAVDCDKRSTMIVIVWTLLVVYGKSYGLIYAQG